MDALPNSCQECPARLICRCLQITESDVIEAINNRQICSLNDIRRHTGAGDGCTACHDHLNKILEMRLPIATVHAAC